MPPATRRRTAPGSGAPAPDLRAQHKQLTRARLVSAAVDVFEEKGYDATTVDDVAARAGSRPCDVLSALLRQGRHRRRAGGPHLGRTPAASSPRSPSCPTGRPRASAAGWPSTWRPARRTRRRSSCSPSSFRTPCAASTPRTSRSSSGR
ncbi:TetR/AcrR family transcriptional regulator [Yinghuangia aomiensis]